MFSFEIAWFYFFFWGEGHLPLYPLHFVDLYLLLYLWTTKSLTQTFSTRCISLQPKTEFSLSHISCFKIMKLFTLCEESDNWLMHLWYII